MLPVQQPRGCRRQAFHPDRVAQITAEVNERNAEELGTDYFEVDWHPAARPDHQAWQGKVYSREELQCVCGLGSKTGLCGINCRHVYYPLCGGFGENVYR